MNILTLDLGNTTGYAISHNGKIEHTGTVDFFIKPKNGIACNSYGAVGDRALNWVYSMHETYQLNWCYFEQARGGAGELVYQSRYGYIAAVCTCCHANGVYYEGIPPTVIKAFMGKGNASKEQIIKAVQSKGFNPIDDNEADAIALMLYVIEKKQRGLIEYSKKAVKKA